MRLQTSYPLRAAVVALATLACSPRPAPPPAPRTASPVPAFRQTAVYLNDADQPMGGRYIHTRTGFTLDLLDIQSVPQGLIWVNSFPTSDMGEPHTQEHLLLSRGNTGRAMASLETMALSGSSAFTMQLRTVYHFNTAAGAETFYTIFERQMDALLHPDYTDEEIRREVRNFGIAENPADSALRIEEKGTVYNEMVSSFDRATTRAFRAASQMTYGAQHPLSYSAGGTPEAIREMRAEHIRKFHADNYHLRNMGMVGSFPRRMPADSVLARMDAILNRLEPNPTTRRFPTKDELPAPAPAPAGEIRVVTYPHRNAQQPGNVVLVWPATRQGLELRERYLLQLFLQNIASDPTTNLYKMFVDGKTRVMDLGARSVFSFLSDEMGYPPFIGLGAVEPRHMTEPMLDSVRRVVLGEIARVAALPDGSPELGEFNTRMKSRVIELRRELAKFVNSPPGFGLRGTGAGWMSHLDELEETGRHRRSVTAKPELAYVDSILNGSVNPWRERAATWKLTGVVPYVVAEKPDPDLLARDVAERQARVAAETARLRALYSTADDQATLRRYRTVYDSTTTALERLAAAGTVERFVDRPPMTLDDELDWRVDTIAGAVPVVASTFENMTSATTGLALKLDGVAEQDLVYVSLMPSLLTGVGVIENGTPVPYDRMTDRLRREILSLNATFSTNASSGRTELVVRGAGNDLPEALRAIGWMRLALLTPDWRPENLARIRDLVDQQATSLRNVTQGSEESWVQGVANGYRRQNHPTYLAAATFLTRAHNAHRMRWLLRDPGAGAERDAISRFLVTLGSAGQRASRADFNALLGALRVAPGATPPAVPASLAPVRTAHAALPAGAKALASDAAGDLAQILSDVPDASFGADVAYLAAQIRQDLLIPPAEALSRLDAVRRSLLATGGARAWMIGSRASQRALVEPLRTLVGELRPAAVAARPASVYPSGVVLTRLRDRAGVSRRPDYVALVQPNLQSGVFLNSAPLVTYADTSREAILRYLASKIYAGGGAHGIFMKTWGAGLAYSNGLGGSPSAGRVSYYAERTPELPQTLKFVINEIRRGPVDTTLADYALAVAFEEGRAALTYEARGESMASDLADGITPAAVRRFREKMLATRTIPRLADSLFARMPAVYSTVLPGFDRTQPVPEGAVYMVIGNERQLGLWEAYLKSEVAANATLMRLYPRDFWMTAPVTTP